MADVSLLAQASSAVSAPFIEPLVILLLCVMAGVGTLWLLPSRGDGSKRRIGATVLIAAALIFVAAIVHAAAAMDHSGTGPYFWIFSGIALVGAVRVITHQRPVYSALYFVLTVFASAGLFVLMYAEFMAAALVLIYAGAILITYVFVIMLAATAQQPGSKAPLAGLADCDLVSREPFIATCVGFSLMGVFLFLIFDKANAAELAPPPALPPAVMAMKLAKAPTGEEAIHGTTQSIGTYLFTNQLVNLELAGLILTVAMVGAIVIARRRVVGPDDAFEPTSETITATMTPVDDSPTSIPVYGTTDRKQKAFPQN